MRSLLIILVAIVCIGTAGAQTGAFIEAAVDNPAPRVGQPIVYSVRIYTTDDLSQAQVEQPDFRGFGRSNFDFPTTSSGEVRNGTRYTVTTQQVALYPLESGTLTIDPFRVVLPATPFQSMRVLNGPGLTINVQALPDNAPASFRNAIGQFDITASVEQVSLRAGEPFDYRLSVTGNGNIERITAPPLPFPENWQIFEQSAVFDQNSLSFGTKIFRWSVIPDEPGNMTIPAIEFAYFDPQLNRYEVRLSSPLTIIVEEANEEIPASDPAIAASSVVASTLTPDSNLVLRPLADSSTLPQIVPGRHFWLLWMVPLLALVLAILLTRPKQSRANTTQPRPAPRKRSKHRSNSITAELLSVQYDEPRAAYEKIHNTLLNYLSQKVGAQVQQETIAAYTQHLPHGLQRHLVQCVEEAASGAYAPIDAQDVRRLQQRTMQVIREVEKRW